MIMASLIRLQDGNIIPQSIMLRSVFGHIEQDSFRWLICLVHGVLYDMTSVVNRSLNVQVLGARKWDST